MVLLLKGCLSVRHFVKPLWIKTSSYFTSRQGTKRYKKFLLAPPLTQGQICFPMLNHFSELTMHRAAREGLNPKDMEAELCERSNQATAKPISFLINSSATWCYQTYKYIPNNHCSIFSPYPNVHFSRSMKKTRGIRRKIRTDVNQDILL